MADSIRPSGIFDVNYQQDMALNRTWGDRLWRVSWIGFLLLFPFLTAASPLGLSLVAESWVGTFNQIAIFTIAVVGLNLLVGYTGLISLGHAAFMGVGAYSSAIFARELGMPFWLALPSSAIFTALVGLMFGLPSLRVKGFYLGMATLAAQFIIPWVLRNPLAPLTNGSNPLEVPSPMFFGIELNTSFEMYYVIIPITILLMLVARNISRTRTGRAFISIRDNDLAAELLGINVFWYKLQAFFISALYAGIAGCLLAFNNNSLAIDQSEGFFGLNTSIRMLGMLIIGGAGFPLGAFFGVTFFKVVENYVIPPLSDLLVSPPVMSALTSVLPFIDSVRLLSAIDPIMFGIILITFLILEPRGLAHRWEILKISWKIRPFSH
jgi:branched-chain amino acid transport system permease protein